MFTQGRITVGVLSGLSDFMRSEGLDLPALAAKVGFIPDATEHEDSGYIPFDAFIWLLEAGAHESGDDSFGLRFAEKCHLEATGLIYYITQNAPNLREVFRAQVRFSQIMASGYSVEFHEGDEGACFSWRFSRAMPPHRQFMDYAIALAVLRVRQLFGQDWQPVRVQLQRGRPRKLQHFERLLGPGIRYDQAQLAIVTSPVDLERPLPHADSRLLRELVRGADAIIRSPDSQDFLQLVSAAIAIRLAQGVPPIDEVAAALALSRRTLQRRLQDNGVSYRGLIDLVQANLMRHMLMETNLPLIEISLLLGFSEASSFSRAAREWLGETPIEFRARNRIK